MTSPSGASGGAGGGRRPIDQESGRVCGALCLRQAAARPTPTPVPARVKESGIRCAGEGRKGRARPAFEQKA